MTPVRLEPTASRSRVKNSIAEPLRSRMYMYEASDYKFNTYFRPQYGGRDCDGASENSDTCKAEVNIIIIIHNHI